MPSTKSPHHHGMGSFWTSEPSHLAHHRTTPDLPENADIVVVGAGYSSAAFVTHLLSDLALVNAPSIVVLESRQLCFGATGRNGGHLKPDNYYATARLAKKYGVEAAAELAEFENANVRAVTEFVTKEKVDCDFVLTRAIDVQLTEDSHRSVEQAHKLACSAGVKSTKETFVVPEQHAEKVSGVKGARSAYSYTAGHLWPYKLIEHMFAKAIEKGVNLQTNTPVTGIPAQKNSDGTWHVTTSRGITRAKKVIMTTNAYTAALLPEYNDHIIPYKAVCCRIACPSGRAPLLSNTYSLRFADWDFDYLIPRPDGSIIVGGARSQYLHRLEDWYGNTDDSTMINGAKEYFDNYMQRHFRGWEDSDARVTDIWTGIMGYSSDRLPRVGPIPHRSGMYIMAGFTGHGMPQIFLTAAGLATMVQNGTSLRDSGVPRIFEETEERLAKSHNDVMALWKMTQPRHKL
ncbi:hypothetical protein E8E14_009830 [Neopestalotiopsis sp. 37M]|nr:hypothetical protein E8E14_009830 [Neopestalotiopsis sp. 37M]